MRPLSPGARAALAAGALALPVYLATMNRTVGFIDRGELAAVAATFGIPHATGYPTLMLLSGALVHAVPLRPVLVLNAFAALLVAVSVALLARLCDRVIAAAAPEAGGRARAVIAGLAALVAACSGTWWQQANGFEVYALHVVAMPLLVLLALRWLDACGADDGTWAPRRRAGRAGAAFALATGLALTNHLTTVLLAPGLVLIAARRLGARGLLRRLPGLAPPFLLGLLPYAWLPLRSRMQPRFDWGDPETLRGFVHHVTGGDYRGWMFSDPAAMADQARYLAWRVPADFAWAGLVLAGLGALALARRAGALAAAVLLCVAAGAVFAIGYRISDVDAYLLPAVFGLALLVAAGLGRLLVRAGAPVALGCAIALVAGNVALHARESDESSNRMVEDYARDLLGPLPRGAVLFSPAWDNVQAGTLYFQEVEGLRRDVVVVNPDLTRVSWYLDELARRAPELAARAGNTLPRFRDRLRAIERGAPYRGGEVEALRRAFLDAFVAGALRDRAVFATHEMPQLDARWHRVPWRLAFALRADSSYLPEPAGPYALRPWRGRLDHYVALTCWAYGEARVARARYEAAHGHRDAARAIAAEAASFDPGIRPERAGPLPLGEQRLVLATAAFFRELRVSLADAGIAAPPAPR